MSNKNDNAKSLMPRFLFMKALIFMVGFLFSMSTLSTNIDIKMILSIPNTSSIKKRIIKGKTQSVVARIYIYY